MEAVSTSETLVSFYQTTQHNIPDDSHLQVGYWARKLIQWRACEGMNGSSFKTNVSRKKKADW
jgi:hypothetical protein